MFDIGGQVSPPSICIMHNSSITLTASCWQAGLLLLVHGEVTDPSVDFFDRERIFINQVLKPIMDAVPDLKIVLEHITTADAADFVANGPATLGATITPQHMLFNRNSLFVVSPIISDNAL